MSASLQLCPSGDDALPLGPWAALAGAGDGLRKLRATGRLTRLPLSGEKIGRTEVVSPRTDRFLEISGDAFNRGSDVGDPLGARPVADLAFIGPTFRHSDWHQPSATMLPHDREAARDVTDVPLGSAPQAAAHVRAVIEVRHARRVRLAGNTVEHTGFTAPGFGPGCRDRSATRNTFRHLGGGGLKIGGAKLDGPPADRTGRLRVSDNRIHHAGQVFNQGCGLISTHAFSCAIVHNEIAHTCYTGLSAGWSWGYRETITRDIRIENDLVHDICGGVLSDNGAIYLLGVQPGMVVRGNHIYRVTAADYGGRGIYPDEGSSHMLFEHNGVHGTQGTSFAIHFARDPVVRHNVFARPGEAFVGVGRVEPHFAANLVHNFFLGPAQSLCSAGYRGDIRAARETDANVLGFAPDDMPPCTHPEFREDVPRAIPFARWRAAGHDRNSVVSPLKARETATSFTLPKSSPALAARPTTGASAARGLAPEIVLSQRSRP